ncbi:MAG: DNA polymerase III subunit delta [Anaeroplasmataceae bacterium]|nr:DNA polymerase III subunit delta [Anaeroplasmataceae bacterium]
MAFNFIIVSDDSMALENKIEEIKKGYEITSETISYNLNDEGVYALVDELSTVSLFEETKFIVAKGGEYLLGKDDAAMKELFRVMNNQNSSNVLIIAFIGTVNYSDATFQKLKRFSSFFEIKTDNILFDEFIMNCFQKENYQIDQDAVQLLVSYTENLSHLRCYIDQLLAFKYEDKKITSEDILKIVTKPLDDNVYALIEAVLANDKKLMLKGYQDMKLRSMQASNLVSLLINKFQEMYNVCLLLKSGFNQASLSELFNISSGRAFYMVKNAKSYTLDRITAHLQELNKLDFQIKTGKINADLGLELYFLR